MQINTNEENKNVTDYDVKKVFTFIFLTLFILAFIFLIKNYTDKYLSKNKIPQNASTTSSNFSDLKSYDAIKNASADTDGDGEDNWRELVSGSDPNDSTSKKSLNSSNDEAPDTLTSGVARDIYVSAMYSTQNNADPETLANSIGDNLESTFLPRRDVLINVKENVSKEEIDRKSTRLNSSHVD